MRRRNRQVPEPEAMELRALDRSDELACAPELLSSVERGCTNFLPVVLAHYFRLPKWNRGSDEDRHACAALLPRLMEQFERSHGRIVESYFCRGAFAAAVLTETDEIRVVWGAHELQFPERTILLFDCRSLAYRAWHRLSDSDRRHCQMMIFGVITEVLRRIDRRATSRRGDADDDQLQYLHDELDRARTFYLDAARQQARLRYTAGLLAGALALAAVLAPFVIPLVEPRVAAGTLRALLLCAVSGATGAVVSVLSRMTFDRRTKLTLPNFESAKRDLWFLGALRPFVGAVFGLVMYVFLKSTLLPVAVPTGAADQTFFFTSVAFLAGFSERFAQDIFLRSGRAVSDDDEAAPSTATKTETLGPPSTRDLGGVIGDLAGRPSTNGHAAPADPLNVAPSVVAATETAAGPTEPPPSTRDSEESP
jgi:hypothetical protein